jgi:hypothetical protein
MRRLALVLLVLPAPVALAYTPPPGYQKTGQSFAASAIAVAPNGRVAVGSDNFAGNATVKVYSSLAAVGGTPLATVTDPTLKFITGIEFLDNNTIAFGENGDRDTAFAAVIPASPGTVAPTALAPNGSAPNLGDITVKAGLVYATVANGPNAQGVGFNRLVRFNSNNTVPTVIDNFGTGYAGGVVADAAGNFLLTDTGTTSALVRRFKPDFTPLDTINLAAGNGSGAVDLVFDSDGDLFVSTGNTLTQVRFPGGAPAVTPFGAFGGDFPFPTFLAYTGSGFEPLNGTGKLIVSGFTDEPGAFVIQTPEPATGLLGFTAAALLARRRTRRARA